MPLLSKSIVALLLVTGTLISAADARQNGFPAAENFFPIGVWLQSPTRAAMYKAIGINTFVGLHNGPTERQLAALAQENMHAIADQNHIGLTSANRHVIKAWLQGDEPDNAQPIGLGLYGTCIPASEV